MNREIKATVVLIIVYMCLCYSADSNTKTEQIQGTCGGNEERKKRRTAEGTERKAHGTTSTLSVCFYSLK